MRLGRVVRPLLLQQLPRLAARSVGALLPLRVLGLTSLLDPSPLAKNLEQWIDWTALRSNLDDGRVEALAVAGTAIWTGRTVVFCDSCGHPPRHRSHVLDYVRCPVGVEHILASAAIPMLFPPVHISINMLHGSLVDPLIEDMRLLGNINTFFARGAPGAHRYRQARGKPAYRQVPYIFVGPSRNAIGELAVEVFRSRYGGLKSVRSPDFALLNRLLGPGGAGRGERAGASCSASCSSNPSSSRHCPQWAPRTPGGGWVMDNRPMTRGGSNRSRRSPSPTAAGTTAQAAPSTLDHPHDHGDRCAGPLSRDGFAVGGGKLITYQPWATN